MDLIQRPRRLRGSETLRKMVRETRIDKSSLIYPLFVKEGTGVEEEIPSMEGQYRYSVDRLPYELERLQKTGVSNIMLFGIPDHKDEVGSGAYDENCISSYSLCYNPAISGYCGNSSVAASPRHYLIAFCKT